ncbi:YkgJ family cysteine cluster protein [Desulfurispora thermophila]|uniref:YkgJ family cysteine cluster protein n=1 Tax=Desulfurispora thermophila TaxID=265470 RepID=UPI000368928A|nr:YkgJ family cysteine cluster protein [Desulfurispora thermophila]
MTSTRDYLFASFQQEKLPLLKPDDKFIFSCQDECMGRCCHSIRIFLDPWDVESIARFLQLSTQQFIQQYTRIDFDPRYSWPYVIMRDAESSCCAFMLPDGKCSIYPVRSRNCRTYPLARAVRFTFTSDHDYITDERYFLLPRQSFCFGHKSKTEWNLQGWLADAKLAEYNEKADQYLSVMQFAVEKLKIEKWFNPALARFIFPIIFLPEVLRQKFGLTSEQITPQEFYKRRMQALKQILTDMASSWQMNANNPDKQVLSQMSLMQRLGQLLSG